jgi:3-hydroxyacyl-CoA dehydrogenase
MNTFGAGVIEGVHKAINLAEKDFRGLVIGNDSTEAFQQEPIWQCYSCML